MNGYHNDTDENHWIKLRLKPSSGSCNDNDIAPITTITSSTSNFPGTGDMSFSYCESVGVNVAYASSCFPIEVDLYGYDYDGVGSDKFWNSSVAVKVYYKFNVGAQPGDIIANKRVYANSTTAVGDVAEYFPVNDGVEVGNIIAAEPGKSNSYKL